MRQACEVFAGMGQALARIVAENGGGKLGDFALTLRRRWRCHRGLQAECEVVEALGQPVQQRGHARLGAAHGQAGQAAGGPAGAGSGRRAPDGAIWLASDSAILCWASVMSSAAAEGVGARRSATKSAMVKSVSWPTAETTGRRDAAMARATRSLLKAARSSSDPPPRASTITSTRPERVQFGQRGLNLGGRRVALHGDREEQHVEAGVAAADDVEEVANHRAGGRGDDADGARKCGQRPLAGGVEEAFGLEPLLELFEGQLQRAGADRLHGFGHQLHLAALLVDADPAAHQHVQAVLGAKAQQHGLAAEEHDGQLRVGVFEREVDVAGGRGAVVGDLALDPDVAVLLLDQLANLADQLAHRPDAARRLRLLKGEVELGRRWIVAMSPRMSVIGARLARLLPGIRPWPGARAAICA